MSGNRAAGSGCVWHTGPYAEEAGMTEVFKADRSVRPRFYELQSNNIDAPRDNDGLSASDPAVAHLS